MANTPRKRGLSNKDLLPVELGGHTYEFKFDSRCRVCQSGEKVVLLVNKMLTEGYSYSVIADKVQPLVSKNISYGSIRSHLVSHLPAKAAAIRTIIEDRSKKMQQDFIEGTSNLISPYVLAEVMMKKSFDNIVSNGTVITPKEGLEAAKVLNTFIREEEGQSDLSQAVNQLNKIITAVREVVPPEMFEKIINHIQSDSPLPIEAKAELLLEDENEEPDGEFDPVETGADRDDDEF